MASKKYSLGDFKKKYGDEALAKLTKRNRFHSDAVLEVSTYKVVLTQTPPKFDYDPSNFKQVSVGWKRKPSKGSVTEFTFTNLDELQSKYELIP